MFNLLDFSFSSENIFLEYSSGKYSPFATVLLVLVILACACVRVCACACICVCVGFQISFLLGSTLHPSTPPEVHGFHNPLPTASCTVSHGLPYNLGSVMCVYLLRAYSQSYGGGISAGGDVADIIPRMRELCRSSKSRAHTSSPSCCFRTHSSPSSNSFLQQTPSPYSNRGTILVPHGAQ